jgi:JAB1/Mov34/MPN/PAD-1 ubiquitin protease
MRDLNATPTTITFHIISFVIVLLGNCSLSQSTTPFPIMTSMQIDDDDEPVVEAPLLDNIEEVVMHPLVLLSAADHYHRVARGTRKRVVGILLGSVFKGKVECTNSYAVPFEEDSKNAVSLQKGVRLPLSFSFSSQDFGANTTSPSSSLSFTWTIIFWKIC